MPAEREDLTEAPEGMNLGVQKQAGSARKIDTKGTSGS